MSRWTHILSVPPAADRAAEIRRLVMQWITVATPSFASVEQVDAVIAQLDGPPEGMEARYIGTTGDGRASVAIAVCRRWACGAG
jgi:hypothetical protein